MATYKSSIGSLQRKKLRSVMGAVFTPCAFVFLLAATAHETDIRVLSAGQVNHCDDARIRGQCLHTCLLLSFPPHGRP